MSSIKPSTIISLGTTLLTHSSRFNISSGELTLIILSIADSILGVIFLPVFIATNISEVNWSELPDYGGFGYERYEILNDDGTVDSTTTDITKTIYNLEAGQEYCYTVRAVSVYGVSEESESKCGTPAEPTAHATSVQRSR